MITKEEFITLISNHKKWDDRLDEISEVLKCNPLEMDWVEYGAVLFDRTLELLFKEEGVDDITWWLWEKAGNPEMKMWDESGIEIPTETMEDLWEIVKSYRK